MLLSCQFSFFFDNSALLAFAALAQWLTKAEVLRIYLSLLLCIPANVLQRVALCIPGSFLPCLILLAYDCFLNDAENIVYIASVCLTF